MNINELIGCAVSGDTRAVSELYDRYKNQIYYLCCLLVDGNEDVAAGMLQSAFMHVFGKLNLLKNPETFEAWSYTIAAKRCRSFYAGSGKTIDLSETAEQLPEGAEDENSFPYNNINTSRSDLVGDANACKAIESAVQEPSSRRAVLHTNVLFLSSHGRPDRTNLADRLCLCAQMHYFRSGADSESHQKR